MLISLRVPRELTKRPTSFYTLPISDFGADSNGSDVNIVDLPTIRQIVHDRFSSDPVPEAPSAAAASAPPALSTPVVLNVVNATSRDGLAAAVEDAFTARGFTRGRASTAETQSTESSIMYGEDAQEGAQALADQLHLPMTESGAVAPGTVQLTVDRSSRGQLHRASQRWCQGRLVRKPTPPTR